MMREVIALSRKLPALLLAGALVAPSAWGYGLFDCFRLFGDLVAGDRQSAAVVDGTQPPLAPSIPWKLPPVKTVKLGKKLGEGASGAAYLAQLELADGTLVPVVVKRMLRPSEEATEAFLRRELEAMNRAQPEQGTLIRAGGNLFMVQKFFSPDTLKSVIDGPEPRRRELAPKVLESSLEQLERIHRAGLTHNDIKPENMLVRADGQTLPIDFMLARRIGDPEAVAEGTYKYMSPLRWIDETPHPAHDVDSLGVSMLELEAPKLFAPDSPYAVDRTSPGVGNYRSIGRIPDDSPAIRSERAMAHATVVKRSVDDYRKLLAAAENPKAFAKEYGRQWAALHAVAKASPLAMYEHYLVYELVTAPVLGPELWKALPSRALRQRVLDILVSHRDDIQRGGVGHCMFFSFRPDSNPQVEQFLQHPDVKRALNRREGVPSSP
jgi:serine/threonine protein kinase